MTNLYDKVGHVLLVDDDEDDYLLTKSMFNQNQYRKVTLDWAENYETGYQKIRSNSYDAVLVDYDLGGRTGIEFIRQAVSIGYPAPMILYTGRGSYDVDVEAMQAGATLYLTKTETNPLLLERSIRYAIERKQAEKAIRESEEKTRDVLESISDGFFAVDRQWRYIYVNRRSAETANLSPEQMIGKNIWELFPILDDSGIGFLYRQVMEERLPAHYTTDRKHNGRIFDVSIYPTHDGISVYHRDKTEQIQAEKALKESEERFRTSVEIFPDGFAILSAIYDETTGEQPGKIIDFRYEYLNQAGCRLNGRSYEDHVGHTVKELLPGHKSPEFFDRYVRVVETGEPFFAEDEVYEDTFGDGRRLRRLFDVRAVKIGDGIILTWRDVAARKDLENRLKKALDLTHAYAENLNRSNQDLEEFAYSAAHDLQEPLRKVKQFGLQVQTHLGEHIDDQTRDYLTRMSSAVDRMQAMIQDLLELSKVSTHGQPYEVIDLSQVFDDVLSDLEIRIHQEQGYVEVTNLPKIEADPMQMRRLFQNLLDNALKYHEPGVAPRIFVHGQVEVSPVENSPVARLTVEDNGIGFDEEEARTIFQPFKRLHGRSSEYTGTGIGLAICKKIVERHGGSIMAIGKPGQGSTFTIVLPVNQTK